VVQPTGPAYELDTFYNQLSERWIFWLVHLQFGEGERGWFEYGRLNLRPRRRLDRETLVGHYLAVFSYLANRGASGRVLCLWGSITQPPVLTWASTRLARIR